jgi:hypothetical protein
MKKRTYTRKKKVVPEDMDAQLIKVKFENLQHKMKKDCDNSGIDITLQLQALLNVYHELDEKFEKELNLNFDLGDIDETKTFLREEDEEQRNLSKN